MVSNVKTIKKFQEPGFSSKYFTIKWNSFIETIQTFANKFGYNVGLLCYVPSRNISKYFWKTLSKKVAQVSLIKVPLLRESEGLRLKFENVIYRSYFIDNLNLWKKNFKKLWQRDDVCHSIKDGSSKRMAIERKSTAFNHAFPLSFLDLIG